MRNKLLWVLQALLAALFVFSGAMKFVMPVEEMTKGTSLTGGFMHFIGVCEIVGAFGLVLPWALKIKRGLTPLAALCLFIIMIGAVTVTIQTQGLAASAVPAAVGVLLVVLAATRFADLAPETFRIERSTTIEAAPDRVYTLIEDFHEWAAWSPFEKLDLNVKKTFSGSEKGRGAVYAWTGTNKAGEGRMEILEAAPASKVKIKLDFMKPFEAHNTAEFTLAPRGGRTEVTWAMYGKQNFMVKLMSIFVSMDRLMGREFEAGLSNMKSVAERA
jgi:uncharacterized protein YndB with AHSA1/START domain